MDRTLDANRPGSLKTYGVSLVAVSLAGAIRWLLDPWLGDHIPYATFFGAVVVAAWYGGFRPALLATALGFVLALYCFVPPRFSFFGTTGPHLLGVFMFVVVSLAIAGFGGAMRVAQERFEELVRQQAEFSPPTPASVEALRRKHHLRELSVVGFGLTLLVLVAGGVLGYVNIQRLDENERGVAHTHEVLGELEAFLSTLKDAETGQRGYLLTENDNYLQPYRDALKQLEAITAHLDDLTADNDEQQARWKALKPKIAARVDELQRTVALTRAGDRPAAMKIVRADSGKAMMDDLRQQLAALRNVEEKRLQDRREASESSSRVAALSVLAPAAIGSVLLCAVFMLVQRNARLRHRAAFIITEQAERLRTTLASIGDAVITTDTEGCVTTMNAVAESLTGWKADEARGQRLDVVFNIVNEETRKAVENPATRALRDGVIVGLANHTVLISKEGTEQPIDDSAAPIRCREGEVVGCVLVFRDISERHRREAELRERERQFRTLAESIPQLCWMANPDGHIFWYNRRWYDYTGTTFGQMEGWGWQSVHDPAELPRVMEQWKASIATGQPLDIVFPLRGNDGLFHPFLTRVEPVRDGEGEVVRWFGTNTDVSEAKRAEEELRRLATELSDNDRRKDEFLATLAHELRNPLAPIRNALQILKIAAGNQQVFEQTREMMERQLAHLVRLVDDLLDVSRITRGKIDLRRERVGLAAIIQSAVETSRPLIEASKHELTVALPPTPIYVDADVTRLAQVFSNLLNNSAKYTERGGRIWLTVERQGSDVVVSVKDTGVGIPGNMLPHVFGMFTQVDRSLERSQGGLGIGLTLVKRLVEMHGGTVTAHSDGHGQGSEFIVRLPAVSVRTVGSAVPPSDDPAPSAARPAHRVLVADDNEDAAASLAMLLKVMGHEPHVVHDGAQAVEAATTFKPDVVLLDIGMPKMNGYEAAQRIRQLPGGKSMTLVALTGWGQDEDRRRSEEAGFDHHMVKPVDPAALENLLATRPSPE
ncbi:MAG: CHASE3 domain-containing protein [Gemmataceae bacterium]|nr:CHASE3 domain-containing protein [Gemmataceae bacterium]